MKISSRSVKETLHIGKVIAKSLDKGDIVCLFGGLGSGKTVLTKGIASGLGIRKSDILSPTFVLMHPYLKARLPLFHFDLYRLSSPKDILDVGYEEYFYDEGITVIEWAERLKYLLPKDFLGIRLYLKERSRRSLELFAAGQRCRNLLEKIREDISP
ncbi:MAG: tRNA (adenosine(37)-N6)-threonylcarbamoyltransferase complex ATPase subunit type 1 TsaE [Candidatus Omnitrophota bacterium]